MQKSSIDLSDKRLIVLVGPTAIGKSDIAIFLAKQLKTEIISCDSRQFYREMKIGTAVPEAEELAAVPHHFIGHLSVVQEYSAGDYERDALAEIQILFEKYDTLILVGGSGLFEKAVTRGLDDFPEIDPEIRITLNKELEEKGLEFLLEELKAADPEYYKIADLQNPVRIIRALEIYRGSGKTFSSFRKSTPSKRAFQTLRIGLRLPREEIYERINKRVDRMMERGLLEEVRSLREFRNLNSLQTVGYKELFEYLDGAATLEEAIEEIKKNTRRYAKRQLTWYRKEEDIKWFSPFEKEKIWDYIKSVLL